MIRFILFNFISILLHLYNSSPSPSEILKNKRNFYNIYHNRIIKEKTYNIELDDEGLYLTAGKNLPIKTPVMMIPTNFFFSSCHFYPLKDEISQILKEVLQYAPEDIKKRLFSLYNLIFYLMYHKVGSKQSASTYYQKNKNFTYSSKFYNYQKTPDELNFFNQQIIKNLFYSTFFLPDEDIELIKEFGYDYQNYLHAISFYDQLKGFSKQAPQTVKDYFITFFTEENLKVFKDIAGYVFRYSFPVKKVDFQNLYKNDTLFNEFLEYEQFLIKYSSIEYDDCFAVMPFTEVLRHHQPKHEKDIVNFTARIYNDRVLFYFNKDFLEGETLKYTYGNKFSSNEILLLDYGLIEKDNNFNTETVEVLIKKKHFNNDKASICQIFNCTPQDIHNMLGTTGKSMNFYYKLSLDKLSKNLLNIFKLKSIPNILFNAEKLYPYLLAEARLDYNTETLTVVNYYQVLLDKNKNFEAVYERFNLVKTNKGFYYYKRDF